MTTGTTRLTLEPELAWQEVAPLLDELQAEPGFERLTVSRWTARPGAGGPGFDLVPVLITVTMTALAVEAVRDVIYPKLKGLLYNVYRKLPGMTHTGKVYPMGLLIVDGELEASYRLPVGLSDVAFGEAITSVPTHFATLRGKGRASLVFTYDAAAKGSKENVAASEFRTAGMAERPHDDS